MNLALAAFTKLAEERMRWEVTTLAGPKSQANAKRESTRFIRAYRPIMEIALSPLCAFGKPIQLEFLISVPFVQPRSHSKHSDVTYPIEMQMALI